MRDLSFEANGHLADNMNRSASLAPSGHSGPAGAIPFRPRARSFIVNVVSRATLLLVDGLIVEAETGSDVIDLRSHGLRPDSDNPETLEELARLLAPYSRIVVAAAEGHAEEWRAFLQSHHLGGELIGEVPSNCQGQATGRYAGRSTQIVVGASLGHADRFWKRLFDLVFSVVALIGFVPLFMLISIAIAFDTPGPIIFRQSRLGRNSSRFEILKFRTMRHDSSDTRGLQSTKRDDDRTTRVGRILRRSSLDELPQLVNVLLGHMSLVGPRPHCLESRVGQTLFWQVSSDYWRRHSVRPGITGLAQVLGNRGSIHSIEELDHRLRCDLEYVCNWRFSSDVAILLRTVRVMTHSNAF